VQAEKMSNAKQVFAVLSGWAETDPEGANQHWLVGDKYDRTEKEEALYSGMAASNPELALEKYAFQQGNLAPVYDAILDSAIQRGGLEAADKLVNSVLSGKSPAAQSPDQLGDFRHRQFESLFAALTRRQIQAAVAVNDTQRVLAWLEPHVGQRYTGEDNMSWAMSYIAEENPQATMLWLNDRVDQMPDRQAWWCIRVAASEWRKQDPVQFGEWVKSNPDHPRLTQILSGAWGGVIQQAPIHGQRAREWAENVGNPIVSSLIDSWIQEAEKRKQQSRNAGQ
jgi:hypothetical protein